MSNMNTNRKDAKANETRSASITNQPRQKLQEEFGSEFELDTSSAQVNNQVNNFAETKGKTGIKQPVSERTAWH
ncbi:hypothetical protein [Lysinibacillus fusiformis]|uniref:hypothetical protein n=1 Tax=Lysinibacillus fusiformis TaxID=28031 RepID=UPI003CE67B5A